MTLARGCAALLVAAGLLLPAAPALAWDADYGRVWRGDGVLERGCHAYGFHYRVRPGAPTWAAEFFLIGPGREELSSDVKAPESGDRRRGRGHFRLCRSVTRPGRFTIRGKLTITEESPLGGSTVEKHWVKPVHFRLRRP